VGKQNSPTVSVGKKVVYLGPSRGTAIFLMKQSRKRICGNKDFIDSEVSSQPSFPCKGRSPQRQPL